MKFKNFTQAYFLIKNNDTYAASLGKRAMASAAAGTILGLFFLQAWPSRIYANDRI